MGAVKWVSSHAGGVDLDGERGRRGLPLRGFRSRRRLLLAATAEDLVLSGVCVFEITVVHFFGGVGWCGRIRVQSFPPQMTWNSTMSSGYSSLEEDSEEYFFTARTSFFRKPLGKVSECKVKVSFNIKQLFRACFRCVLPCLSAGTATRKVRLFDWKWASHRTPFKCPTNPISFQFCCKDGRDTDRSKTRLHLSVSPPCPRHTWCIKKCIHFNWKPLFKSCFTCCDRSTSSSTIHHGRSEAADKAVTSLDSLRCWI